MAGLLTLTAAQANADPVVLSASGQGYQPIAAPRGVRTHRKGDVVFSYPLVWSRAAILAKTVNIVTDSDSKLLIAGHTLQLVELRGVAGLPEGQVTAFCSPLELVEQPFISAYPVGRKVLREKSDQQFCVVDSDADGKIDRAFELNGGSPAARVAKPIAPVAYEVRNRVPVSDGDDTISLSFSPSNKGPGFLLAMRQRGMPRPFDSIAGGGYASAAYRRFAAKDGWPQQAEIFGTRFTITTYDAAAGTVTIDWSVPSHDDFIPVPTETIYTLRWY